MITVSIIGSGKVAHHLALNLLDRDGLVLQQIYARNPKKLPSFICKTKIIDDINLLIPADIVIVAVADNAIAEVVSSIQLSNQLIAHTSGSTSIDSVGPLKNNNRMGVFYMLQTFSKEREVDFSKIPFCLEATNETDFDTLEKIALKFSEKVFKINSEQRKSIHVGAVFVSNFVNHLYVLGEDICKENKVPFDILKPLITETANKIEFLSPREAQTGPAIRRDTNTIENHLKFLIDDNKRNIYKILTNSIQKR